MSNRAFLPAASASTYLNTGAAGPLTVAAFEALSTEIEWELRNGRVGTAAKKRFFNAVDELKAMLSRMLKCHPAEIAIAESTTVALNIAIWGLDLRRGDAVLTTASEHIGALAGLLALQKRSGVEIQMYHDVQFSVDEFFSQADAATKAVLISHVSWQTGEALPIADICAEARARGLRTIVDGAQSVGAIPVDLSAIGADYYAFPAQKWTLGPEGIAGLFVANRAIDGTLQTFAGPFSFGAPDSTGARDPTPGAARFEIGTRFRGVVQAWIGSLRWVEETIGWPTVFEQTASRRQQLCDLLRPVAGIRLFEPSQTAGLVTIELPECLQANDIVNRLEESAIRVRSVPGGNRLRASTAFFNEEQDFDRFTTALSELTRVI